MTKTLYCSTLSEYIDCKRHLSYHNFIKPHMALDGKTPSEKAGITIEGNNKWLTLMKTSLSHKRYKKSC